MKALSIILALLVAAPSYANPCANGRCPIPRWQAVIPGHESPSPQLRTATCRIHHQTGRGRSWGSGTLVRTDNETCVLLTCAHLFRDGDGKTTVWFSDGSHQPATLLGIDRQHDLAALSVEVTSVANGVELAASDPQHGDVVYGCGYGQTGRFRCQAGSVVGFGRSQHGVGAAPTAMADTMLFSGGARQGDSGGGVFNRAKQLVGVLWGTDDSRTTATTCHHVRQFLCRLLRRRSRGPQRPHQQPRPDSQAGHVSPMVPVPPLAPVAPRPQPTEEPSVEAERILSLANRLDALRQRVEASDQANLAATTHSTERLNAITATLTVIQRKLEGQRGEEHKGDDAPASPTTGAFFSPLDWLLPVALGALGISTPPTAMIVTFKLFRWWARRRIRKRRQQRSRSTSNSRRRSRRRRRSHRPPSDEPPSPPGLDAPPPPQPTDKQRPLNDDYAEQLNSLMEYSGGRTVAQDATLGREYDRELRQAASRSSNSEVTQFANKLLRRVTHRFGRIHADNPVPAEPATS